MTPFAPIRELPKSAPYKKGDVLVLFGELFGRGYANGIVDQAKKHGLTLIGATVGRRDSQSGELRPLTQEELQQAEQNLGGKIINVPLEAGFDLEKAHDGSSPADQLKSVKLNEWVDAKLNWAAIEQSQSNGKERFQKNLNQFVSELEKLVPKDSNIIFVHTMAGGMIRAKILMPVLNKVFKGVGDRFISSSALWNSDLGKLCATSFEEVTANTFWYLIEATRSLHDRHKASGNNISYVAYGYHGTDVWMGNKYEWQTYSPYVQGWAKIKLEEHAKAAQQLGIKACVFNCPEILTNSSSVFLGVELSLYTLVAAIEKDTSNAKKFVTLEACKKYLKEGLTLQMVVEKSQNFIRHPIMNKFMNYNNWPMHNEKDQAELMLKESDELFQMNRDEKDSLTDYLSRIVFEACGYVMFHESYQPRAHALWIGHDAVAKAYSLT